MTHPARSRPGARSEVLAADEFGRVLPVPARHRETAPAGGPPAAARDVDGDSRRRRQIEARLGQLRSPAYEAVCDGRGRDFQRFEFIGDALLELILHGHATIRGPGCPLCEGRADRFTTDANLALVAHRCDLGEWLDWHPSEQRLADLVESCVGAAWWSGRWGHAMDFVADNVHELPAQEQRWILHGGTQVHPEAPARAREILGAAILEAAAAINAFLLHPEGNEGDLSRLKARLLSTEHVMSRARDSKWVHRRLRTRHFDRDDVERKLATEMLDRGMAAGVTIAAVLTK